LLLVLLLLAVAVRRRALLAAVLLALWLRISISGTSTTRTLVGTVVPTLTEKWTLFSRGTFDRVSAITLLRRFGIKPIQGRLRKQQGAIK